MICENVTVKNNITIYFFNYLSSVSLDFSHEDLAHLVSQDFASLLQLVVEHEDEHAVIQDEEHEKVKKEILRNDINIIIFFIITS